MSLSRLPRHSLTATALVTFLLVSTSDAALIVWEYTGVVAYSIDHTEVPIGTPASFRVTVPNPSQNLTGAHHPEWAGAYWASMVVDLAGARYELTRAALEINMDPLYNWPHPGQVLLRQFTWEGPPLFGRPMGSVGCYSMGSGGCMMQAGSGADPTSPALPLVPPPTFNVYIFSSVGTGALLRIIGSTPQVIPEPFVSLLIGAGLIGFACRHRRRRAPQNAPGAWQPADMERVRH